MPCHAMPGFVGHGGYYSDFMAQNVSLLYASFLCLALSCSHPPHAMQATVIQLRCLLAAAQKIRQRKTVCLVLAHAMIGTKRSPSFLSLFAFLSAVLPCLVCHMYKNAVTDREIDRGREERDHEVETW